MTNSNRKSLSLTLEEIASRVDAEVVGDASTVISGAAPIEKAATGDISFVANKSYLKHIETTSASALVLDKTTDCTRIPTIRHDNPYLTFAKIIDILFPVPSQVPSGVAPSAVLSDDSVTIDSTAGIGELCHIGARTTIGKDSQLVSSVFVGTDVSIGDNCLIYPGAKIMNGSKIGNNVIIHPGVVVGSDGFGFAESPEGLKKIQQLGWVEIEDFVEIGSNTTIDRGALGPTRIGFGTKIDNLVQIAHNVEIGKHSIIVSQVGISGSTKIGNGVILAGQVGVVGHIEIGDRVMVGAQSGIAKSIEAGQTVFGSPALPIKDTMKIEAAMKRLPDLLKRVKKLEKNQPE